LNSRFFVAAFALSTACAWAIFPLARPQSARRPDAGSPAAIVATAALSSQQGPLARIVEDKPGALARPARAIIKVTSKNPLASRDQPGRSLLDNWDLSGTEMTKEALAPFLAHSQPASMVFYGPGRMKRLYPLERASGEAQSDQILFFGSDESIQRTAREREEQSAANGSSSESLSPGDFSSGYGAPSSALAEAASLRALPENAFLVGLFRPGKRDNGEPLVPVASDLVAALQGPDYSFDLFDDQDDDEMRAHLATVLSLGHGGDILLNVAESGFLRDEPGADFSIFQTTFRVAGSKYYWQKFAYVGVSDSAAPETFRWFECDPLKGTLVGCAGAVPTTDGGDRFDLAALGAKDARYIWLKDFGKNKNRPSKWPTEGISLDAVRLTHARSKK
jgi:hypothetical protein